jgi:transcriptional regulator with XRE-family HTH domain
MSDPKLTFAKRLKAAMEAAGYQARPSVLEREFNIRHWGKPMTLHGVRRWLLGETMPRNDKIIVLANWLGVMPESLGFGENNILRAEEPKKAWGPEAGYHDRELLEAVMSLPVAQRRIVREVIMTFARDAERERQAQEKRLLPAERKARGRAAPAPEDLSAAD